MARKSVGIDVAKDKLDVDIRFENTVFQTENNRKAIERLVTRLVKAEPDCVVLEGTGGYEHLLLAELHLAGLPVAAVNPNRARSYAKALGFTAKTDTLDASALAQFGESVELRLKPVPDPITLEIKALVTRRRQLLKMIQAEKNRTEHAHTSFLKGSFRRSLRNHQRELDRLELELKRVLESSPLWQHKVELLTSTPGVGTTTAMAIVAHLPELGTLDRRELAALAGLAPINRDSGKMRGKRMIGGGRGGARKAMYMSTLVATQHNPVIREHYHRLQANGKTKMTALVACMRKLLIILNAMIRDNRPWSPKCA